MTPDRSKQSRRALLRAAGMAGAAVTALSVLPSRATAREPERDVPIYAPLDPGHTVILFADLQSGIVERSATNDLAHLRRAVGALAKLARLHDMATIVTTAPADGGPVILPEITSIFGAIPLFTRTTTDAFTHSATREAIEKTARKTLLVAGVATEIIVQHSALSALARGYHVQVVIDACGGLSARTEDAILRRMTESGVELTCVASVAGQLAGDFTTSKGAATLAILYEMASG